MVHEKIRIMEISAVRSPPEVVCDAYSHEIRMDIRTQVLILT